MQDVKVHRTDQTLSVKDLFAYLFYFFGPVVLGAFSNSFCTQLQLIHLRLQSIFKLENWAAFLYWVMKHVLSFPPCFCTEHTS